MKKKTKKEKKQDPNPEESIEISSEFITTVPQLKNFIKKIPKCHTISSRLNATKNLLEIKTDELYKKFIEVKGLYYLSIWLKEYKKSVSSGTELTKDEEYIVKNIIHLCENMHLSINDLKTSKIGKNINSLGKALPEGNTVKAHCEEIVAKWREMIDGNENNDENNEENCEENNGFQNQQFMNMGGMNYNNNQLLNSKTKRNNNSNSFSVNNTSNNINLNTNSNTSNKINSIKIKTYVIKIQLICFFLN